MVFKERLALYYKLTKPGIVYGNLVTAAAGFLLAARGSIDWSLFITAMIGTSLVIASACVFNNILDRQIDKRMARTSKRAVASGLIGLWPALIYAKVLGVAGFLILVIFTNLLVVELAALAVVFYVLIYGFVKRRSVHGALVGTIPGAAPPVMGYCAVTDHLDSGALILFLVLVFWQMPHFYGIALYRFKDYKAAKIPVMPAKAGVFWTKVLSIIYIIAFLIAVFALWAFGYTGKGYLLIVELAGLYWLWVALRNFKSATSGQWGRKVFLTSLAVNLIFSAAIAFDWLLVKI